MAEVYKADPVEIGPLIPLEQRDIGRAGPLQQHPTEQHMITYALSDDQLDLIQSGGSRFTIGSTIASFMWSATIACALTGLSVPSPWTAAQYSCFLIAPILTGVIALAASVWAGFEYRDGEKRKNRIKRRSFAPGTIKTLEELKASDDV